MNVKACFKKVYNKDYWILICIGFLPLMWKILEIAFLSSSTNALKILGQFALISIIFKIFEESLSNPLYKTLSKQNFKTAEEKYYVAKRVLIYYFFATILFSISLYFLSGSLLKLSHVPDYIFNETLQFVKLYIIASAFGVYSKFLYTFNLINKDTKKMFIYLLIKSLATTILFICMVPEFSLNLGANGIAVSEIIINLITVIYLSCSFPKSEKSSVKINLKEYFKLFLFSLSETLIRNIVYYCVILVFLNIIDSQELYFVSNEFIWSIMLVPTLAQGSLIKQDYANNKNASLKPYFINAIILTLFLITLIPVSLVVFKSVYSLQNYMDYFIVLLKLSPCYVVFIIDSVIEAYFITIGKMHHILIQNIITNILVYVTALILYWCNIWVITLNSIVLLFNLGVILSSFYTITVYLIEQYTKNKKKVSS